MPTSSLPLKNLRGVLIVLILAFHSFSAYIVTQPAAPPAFDQPPYDWLAFPIIDNERWIGFDVFCAFQFLYLMQLMFFLSGVFVWPSLRRRGARPYLYHRLWRLGAPFLLGVYLLMPLAYYPVYRVTAVDPEWSAFWAHWTALPLTPTGPMWFLWFLIALNIGAVAIYRLPARAQRSLARLVGKAAAHPGGSFVGFLAVSAITYLPLAAFYSPWKWLGVGPFEIQAAFAPQYALYFLLGLAVGAHGYERGLFAVDGSLMRHWSSLVFGGLAAFLLWIVPTALIAKVPGSPVALLRVVGDFGLVAFAAAACFAMTAVFLRFAAARWPLLDPVSENAYSIYFFHYLFVLWLQYALLGLALPAVGKGAVVVVATVILSLAASLATNWMLAGVRIALSRAASLGQATASPVSGAPVSVPAADGPAASQR